MPRERIYDSNAQRQAAYRARVAERAELAGTGQLTGRLSQLETALAAAVRRADTAEARAARAERQAAVARDRYAELAAALARVTELEATVAELQARLSAASGSTGTSATTASGMNRAARRAAERDRRRHGQ